MSSGGDPATPVPPAPASRRASACSTTRERVWRLFDDPTSSTAASVIAGVVIAMIVLSTTAFIVQTLPQFVFSPNPAWDAIEKGTIAVFTTEFVLRISCCPSLLAFVRSPMNVIDFLAIAPFYAELIYAGAPSGSSSAILRILRLVRIFRVFKVSRYLPWVRVFASALTASMQPLLMLVFIIMIAMVVFSSAIYYAERGEWDEARGAFMRDPGDGTPPVPSPYQSIPDSMWWCIVTMTTVGYGDMVPLSPLGRFIASLAALSGILVLAIPITVISTNFNAEYDKLQKQRAAVRARVLLLKTHFRERRTGLEAVLDEVDDLVRRNTQELAGEVATLFEAARADLTAEVQEIVRMAYERRRVLHLAAMTAGHVSGGAQLRLGRAGAGEATAAASAAGPAATSWGRPGDAADADDAMPLHGAAPTPELVSAARQGTPGGRLAAAGVQRQSALDDAAAASLPSLLLRGGGDAAVLRPNEDGGLASSAAAAPSAPRGPPPLATHTSDEPLFAQRSGGRREDGDDSGALL